VLVVGCIQIVVTESNQSPKHSLVDLLVSSEPPPFYKYWLVKGGLAILWALIEKYRIYDSASVISQGSVKPALAGSGR
jgi:hypothetical protein